MRHHTISAVLAAAFSAFYAVATLAADSPICVVNSSPLLLQVNISGKYQTLGKGANTAFTSTGERNGFAFFCCVEAPATQCLEDTAALRAQAGDNCNSSDYYFMQTLSGNGVRPGQTITITNPTAGEHSGFTLSEGTCSP